MINNIIVTGTFDSLMDLTLPSKSVELANTNWMTNCFGISISAYCHEMITEEQHHELSEKFYWVDSGLYYQNVFKEYLSAVGKLSSQFYKPQKSLLLANLGIDLALDTTNVTSIRKLAYMYSAMRLIDFDIARPEEYNYIVNSEISDLSYLPDIEKTSAVMMRDFKMEGFSGQSKKVFISNDMSVIAAQTKTMFKFLESILMEKTLADLKFINSDSYQPPENYVKHHAMLNSDLFELVNLEEWIANGKLTS